MRSIFHLIALLVLIGIATPAYSQVGVQNVLGAQLSCDFSNPNCSGFPTTLSVICISTNPTCPDNWHPDLVTSARFWGVRDPDCVTSTDTGATWSLCTTQPFTALSGIQVAGASDGSVIAMGNPAGVCTVKRSTDSGTTWPTVFTDATQCGMGGAVSQVLLCQTSGNRCDFAQSVGGTFRSYKTTDNGVNWTLTNHGGALGVQVLNSTFDGTAGVYGGLVTPGNKALYATGGAYQLSTAWPAGNVEMGFMFGGVPNLIAGNGTAVLDRYDVNGVLQGTVTPIGMQTPLVSNVDNSITILNYGGSFYYVIAERPTGQGFWLSQNNLVTTSLLATNARPYGRATMRRIGNKVYYSIAGGNFGVIQ